MSDKYVELMSRLAAYEIVKTATTENNLAENNHPIRGRRQRGANTPNYIHISVPRLLQQRANIPSNPNNSPCCHGIFPKPVAYEATKMIIESNTIADHAVEYLVPSIRSPLVCRVRTVLPFRFTVYTVYVMALTVERNSSQS
jgi:hypothetical protein